MTVVGLPTVAIVCVLADLAGNSVTRRFSRGVFAVLVLLELQVAATVGGVASWGVDVVVSLL